MQNLGTAPLMSLISISRLRRRLHFCITKVVSFHYDMCFPRLYLAFKTMVLSKTLISDPKLLLRVSQ